LLARRQGLLRHNVLLSFCLSPEFHQPLFCLADELGFWKLIKRLSSPTFVARLGFDNENRVLAFSFMQNVKQSLCLLLSALASPDYTG
jgi:hypothetical protein